MATLIVLVARDALAAILVAASAAKLSHLSAFQDTLMSLGMPKNLTRDIAALFAAGEGLLGLASISLVAPRVTDKVVLIVYALFVLTAAYAVKFRPSVSCTCFGALTESSFDTGTLIRNGIFLVIAYLPVAFTPGNAVYQPNPAIIVAFAAFGILIAQVSAALRSADLPVNLPSAVEEGQSRAAW